MRLKDKVTFITGGNSGIGLGVAEAFKNEGAVGTITGRSEEKLDNALKQLGDRFIAIPGDVTKLIDLERIFREAFNKFGAIDVLVVNAGGTPDGASLGTVIDTKEEDYDKFMALNQKAIFFTVQKAVPYMKEGGSIILMSSYGGHYALPGVAVYSSAKAAIISFARGFAQDLLSRKIRVNALSPGTIDTPIFDKVVPPDKLDEYKAEAVKSIPVGRIGLPSDIGAAAVFLASDESSFVLGTEIISDGGFLNVAPATGVDMRQ